MTHDAWTTWVRSAPSERTNGIYRCSRCAGRPRRGTRRRGRGVCLPCASTMTALLGAILRPARGVLWRYGAHPADRNRGPTGRAHQRARRQRHTEATRALARVGIPRGAGAPRARTGTRIGVAFPRRDDGRARCGGRCARCAGLLTHGGRTRALRPVPPALGQDRARRLPRRFEGLLDALEREARDGEPMWDTLGRVAARYARRPPDQRSATWKRRLRVGGADQAAFADAVYALVVGVFTGRVTSSRGLAWRLVPRD
jgi:hypothetical protein